MIPYFLIALLFLSSFAWAEELPGLEGNRQFLSGNYEQAARSYELQLSRHGESSQGYYNLALAREKSGDIGGASVAYLRALALDPANAEARRGLEQLSTEHELVLPGTTWATRAVATFGAGSFWTIGAVAAWTGGFAVLGGLIVRSMRRWLIGGGVALFIAGKAVLAIALVGDPLFNLQGLAVVTDQAAGSIEIKSNPLEQAKGVARLNSGSAVEVLNTRGRWSYCALADGRKGWIPSDKLQSILPSGDSPAAQGS